MDNIFYISDSDLDLDLDSLTYSDSETELESNYQYTNYQYTNYNKKIKTYDYLERIINDINKLKQINKQHIYYIQNIASTNDINIIIQTYNNLIKQIKN